MHVSVLMCLIQIPFLLIFKQVQMDNLLSASPDVTPSWLLCWDRRLCHSRLPAAIGLRWRGAGTACRKAIWCLGSDAREALCVLRSVEVPLAAYPRHWCRHLVVITHFHLVGISSCAALLRGIPQSFVPFFLSHWNPFSCSVVCELGKMQHGMNPQSSKLSCGMVMCGAVMCRAVAT